MPSAEGVAASEGVSTTNWPTTAYVTAAKSGVPTAEPVTAAGSVAAAALRRKRHQYQQEHERRED